MAKSPLIAIQNKGRLIPILSLSGPEQMAIDELLLENSIRSEKPFPTLRFYKWKGNWLSVGRNQKEWPAQWITLIKQRKLEVVQRPSGGGAVLHSGGLTYSITWPSPPRKRHDAYFKLSKWLINGFLEMGLPLRFGDQQAKPGTSDCFASSTAADLVDLQGHKRIGSAQYWKKGQLLQHGEILLDPPTDLWKEVFLEDPPPPTPKQIPRKDLELVLQKAFCEFLPKLEFCQRPLSKKELEEVSLRANSYKPEVLPVGISTNPEETIPSTT